MTRRRSADEQALDSSRRGRQGIFDHVRNIGIASAVVVAADNASRWFSPPWIAKIKSNAWLIVYAVGLLMLTAGLVASALT